MDSYIFNWHSNNATCGHTKTLLKATGDSLQGAGVSKVVKLSTNHTGTNLKYQQMWLHEK